MKFINYLESITGIGIYPLSSLLLFFSFFMIVTWFVVKADKKYIEQLKNLPFDNKN